jgi:hypothetical protein
MRKHVPRTADLNHWFWYYDHDTTSAPSLRLLTRQGGEDTNCLSDVDCTKSRRRATSIHSQGSNELLMTNCCQHASVLWLHLRSMTPPITAATYSLSPDRSAHGPSHLGLRIRRLTYWQSENRLELAGSGVANRWPRVEVFIGSSVLFDSPTPFASAKKFYSASVGQICVVTTYCEDPVPLYI